jgi:hypothetical protein
MDNDEISKLIDAYLDEGATGADFERLQAWLEEDERHAKIFAHHFFVHQLLRELLPDEMVIEKAVVQSGTGDAQEGVVKPIVFENLGTSSPSRQWAQMPHSVWWVLLLLVVGGVAYRLGRTGAPVKLAGEPRMKLNVGTEDATCVARLTNITNCRWDSIRTTANTHPGQLLEPGQSMHLMEGVAEINSTFSNGVVGTFRIEGPVGLMMSSEGVLSLLYGKVSAEIKCNSDIFALETSLGRIAVSKDASIGVAANANEVEVHVFSGYAVFEPLQLYLDRLVDERLRISSGSALRIYSTADDSIITEHDVANEDEFVSSAALKERQLSISEDYVAAIKKAHPFIYWRFEHLVHGEIPNEMGDRFACHVYGPVRWRSYPGGNRTIELGFAPPQTSFLMTDDTIDDGQLKDGFTVEMWAKPSYYQTGSMFSLARCNGVDMDTPAHAVLIEAIGLAADSNSDMRSRIRFLYRDPPGNDPEAGISCYSEDPYVPGRWQHVVAVKEFGAVRLYLNGKLVAADKDASDISNGLRVLIGQLYSFTSGKNAGTRPFAGELDEVAVYGRPLTSEEIVEHFKLAHDLQTE